MRYSRGPRGDGLLAADVAVVSIDTGPGPKHPQFHLPLWKGCRMKRFFYMGRNERNRSGVSWKLWQIERKGKKVHVSWGRAALLNRRVAPAGTLQNRWWGFRSESEAKDNAMARINEKIAKGYERMPRKYPVSSRQRMP